MLSSFRNIASAVSVFLVVTAISSLISANVREAARKRGWDTGLDRFLTRVVSAPLVGRLFAWFNVIAGWEPLKHRWWLWLAIGLSGGVAVSLWAVSLMPPPQTPDVSSLRNQIAQLQVALNTVTQQRDDALRRAGLPPAPPVVAPPLTGNDAKEKAAAWKALELRMNDLSVLLNQGDTLLDTWLTDFRTNPAAELKKAQDFSATAYRFRLTLESMHDSLTGEYGDVAVLLRDSVRAPGRTPVPGTIFDQFQRAIDTFANDLNASSSTDTDLEDRLGPDVNIFRHDLQGVRNWAEDIKQTATANREALTKFE